MNKTPSREIEKMFFEDVREKKRTGNGAYHKTGKGVKHTMSGALRTPSYFMKPKEKKKLNGEVKVSYLYETIIPRKEFDLKPVEVQKEMLTRWRELYSNDVIQREMGMSSNSQLHKYLVNLDVPRKPKSGGRQKKNTTEQQTLPLNIPASAPAPAVNQAVVLMTNGLHLEYNGTYDSEQLNKIFTKLQLLTEGESNKFKLCISLSEQL